MELEPLEWDKESGRWSWPPTTSNGRKPFGTTIARWEEILRVLATGPVIDRSGRCSAKLQGLMDLDEVSQAHMNHMLRELDALGLIEREVKGRHTKRVALAVPVEQLPEGIVEREVPVAEAVAIVAEDLPWAPASKTPPRQQGGLTQADADRLAHTLLDLVVSRADQEADTEVREELALLQRQHQNLVELRRKIQQDLDKATEKNRQLVLRLEESQQKQKQTERNLNAALGAARDMAAKVPEHVREDTLQRVERIMKRSRED